MKNTLKILIPLVFTTFLSCTKTNPTNEPNRNIGDYDIKVIDSCEYLEYDYGIVDQRVYSLTHKGNCSFCEKRKTNKQK